ncbi:MAG: acyl-CoA dehydrogenase domain protein [Myxococcaceae bacterium]|nr:acyl-CoA dehydrogenase domain protein [Myxococcaceae bacterium]
MADVEARGLAREPELESFRREVAEFLERELPEKLGELPPSTAEFWGGRKPEIPHPQSVRYCELMAERGFTAPTWPQEYGGGGLDKQQTKVLQDELKRLRLPSPLVGFGLTMIGPTLLQFGSDEQKREHLPKIVRGQIRWAQGYSEPNAGSDLAALQTSAQLVGDEFILNGQKVWTSYGEKADWMFALVRSDPHVKKQEGITFLLLDMAQPGVEVRLIKLISGASPFCETFFSDARAHKKDVIYGVGKGWTVAKALLGHERNMIGDIFGTGLLARSRQSQKNQLAELAREYLPDPKADAALSDPILRDRITQVSMDERCFALTMQRSADNVKAGHRPGAESSIFKVYGTELNQRRHELMLSIRGPQALGWEDSQGFDQKELTQTRDWLRSRGNTIEGGTSEVQLNIIAKHVLDLPD